MLKKPNKKFLRIASLSILLISSIFIFISFNTRGYFKNISFIGGDEPHYIMMTDSFLKDKDFNLKNDYSLDRSLSYYGDKLFPHLPPIIDYNKSDNWYSIHTIGLPLLMNIPYDLAGLLGVRFFMIMLHLLVIVVFYFVLKKYIKERNKVLIGLILLVSCSLFWQNFGGIFPDLLMVLFLGLLILNFGKEDLFSNFGLNLVVVIAALTHTKSIVLLAPIYIAHYLFISSKIGFKKVAIRYFCCFLVPLISSVLYIIFLYSNYGIILPSQIYGEKGQLFSGNMLYNFLAILFDRVKGLLIYFPILAVSGPYFYRFYLDIKRALIDFIRHRELKLDQYMLFGLIIGMLALFFTQLGFDDWSGSFSPNGRYMLVFVFATIFIFSRYINYRNIYERSLLIIFTTLNFIISLKVIDSIDVYLDTGKESFISQKILINSGLPIFGLKIENEDVDKIVYSLLLLLIIIILNIFLTNLYSNDKKDIK